MTDEKVIEIIDTSLANEFELDIEKMVPNALLYEDLGLDSLDRVDTVICWNRLLSSRSERKKKLGKSVPLGISMSL